MKYSECREMYPKFIYHGFEIEESSTHLEITYAFEIEGLETFNPKYKIPKSTENFYSDKKVIKNLVFSLGLVEVASYWKATCSPLFEVRCGQLDEKQIAWWKKLYFHGLGEFFYINEIKPSFDDFMTIVCTGDAIDGEDLIQEYKGQLIPVGGGKDSFVTLELLKPLKDENHTFIINKVMSAIHASEAAGYKDQNIFVQRTLDKRLLELNKRGFLNGHTPFSAMVAFTSVISAICNKKKYICLSNEASANESTVQNDTVNHQYSKSYEFEKDFRQYCETYCTKEVEYFSLLRPLSELQIAKIFSTLKPYHAVFKSCNVGSKLEIWCGHCAKCLFVFILLSAYLSDEECTAIFGRNMLDDESLLPIFNELCGISDNKPFECVGTREEVQLALSMAINQRNQKQVPLVKLLDNYYRQGNVVQVDTNAVKNEWNNEHEIPTHLLVYIKEKLEEVFV